MSLYEAPEEVAMLAVGTQEPVQRNIVYPATPEPPASVEEAQLNDIVEVPVAVATTEVGAAGGVVSI